MEIRLLKYFLAIAREENMTRAAASLHIAQPSLSTQMKELENSLGKQLFIRGKRKITLTDEGIILRKRAEEVLQLIELTEKEITLNNNIEGEISIGSGENAAIDYLFINTNDLNKMYQNITYNLFNGDATEIMERLDHGLLDFGILIEPIDTDKYNSFHLPIKEYWGLLVPKNDELANLNIIHAKDLKGKNIIIPKRRELYLELKNWLLPNQHIIATYNLANHAALMVNRNMGYAFVLNDIVNLNDNLRFIPIDFTNEIHVSLVWKKYIFLSKPAQLFLDTIKNKTTVLS